MCNNPFFEVPTITGGKLTGEDEVYPVRDYFGQHTFVLYNNKVYDATLGPALGTENEATYLSNTIDTSTSAEQSPPELNSTPGDPAYIGEYPFTTVN
jgi:hypothetical protein